MCIGTGSSDVAVTLRAKSLQPVKDIAKRVKPAEQRTSEADSRELLAWLSPIDPSENYNTVLQARQDDTGDWLLRGSNDFDAWKTRPNSLLWLNGKGITLYSLRFPSPY
jgi:hypothetical protein